MSVELLQGKRRFDHDGRFDIIAHNWNTARLYTAAIGGSALSVLIAHPLDSLKIYAQVGPRLETRRPLIYSAAFIRTYGLRTLYRGFAPVWWCQMASHAVRLGGTYRPSHSQKPNTLNSAYSWAIGASLLNAMMYSRYDLAVTRMQADAAMPLGYRRFYTSIGDCLRRMRFEEGKYTWLRGLQVAWFRWFVQLSSFIWGLPVLQNYFGGDNYYSTLTSLFTLNFLHTFFLHPLDTAKIYHQTQPMVQPLIPYPKRITKALHTFFRFLFEFVTRLNRYELKARAYNLMVRFSEPPRPYYYPLSIRKMLPFLRQRGIWYAYNGFWFNFWKTCTATMLPYVAVEKLGKKHHI
jgi:hypothetical protein